MGAIELPTFELPNMPFPPDRSMVIAQLAGRLRFIRTPVQDGPHDFFCAGGSELTSPSFLFFFSCPIYGASTSVAPVSLPPSSVVAAGPAKLRGTTTVTELVNTASSLRQPVSLRLALLHAHVQHLGEVHLAFADVEAEGVEDIRG